MKVIPPHAVTDSGAFSRASEGSYYNEDLTLCYAAPDEPRISHVASLVAGTFSVNLLSYSERFDNAAWSKTRATVTANATTAPDGTLAADKLVVDTSASNHYTRTGLVTVEAGALLTASVHFKAAEHPAVELRLYDSTTALDGCAAVFNSTTGAVVGPVTLGSGLYVSSEIEDIGAGWFRASLTGRSSLSATTVRLQVTVVNSSNSSGITDPTATQGVYIWGAKLEAGDLTPYNKTEATPAYYDAREYAIRPSFLIEPARTNVVCNTDTTTSGGAISPGSSFGPDEKLAYRFVPTLGAVSSPQRGSSTLQQFANSKTLGQTADYTFSCHFDKTGPLAYRPRIVIDAVDPSDGNASLAVIQFDASTGLFSGKSLDSGWSEIRTATATMEPCGMWLVVWSVRFTQPVLLRTKIRHYLQCYNNAGSGSYTADGLSGFQYACMQFEEGDAPTSYIRTTTAPVTRTADSHTLQLVTSVSSEDYPAYNAGTTYQPGERVSVAGAAGLRTGYRSRTVDNLGNAPASSPDHWADVGSYYAPYSGAATYALGDRVSSANIDYESLAAGNVGNALTDAAKWVAIGPSNAWAMFDNLRDSVTVSPGPLVVVLTPGERIDAIAGLNLKATKISIWMENAGSVVYSSEVELTQRSVSSWYEYFFTEFTQEPSFALFNLPLYSSAQTIVRIENASGPVECGALVVGRASDIGRIKYEAETDVLNFSTVDRDFAGNTSTLVPRRNVPRTLQEILLNKSEVNRIRSLRDSLGGVPAVWAGIEDPGDGYFESLLILGFYKRFSINLAHPNHAIVSLELEEI